MDQPFFYGSQTCGMCLAMHGTGPGSGGMLPFCEAGTDTRIGFLCQGCPGLHCMYNALLTCLKSLYID